MARQRREVVLDTSVVGTVAGQSPSDREASVARLQAARARGDALVVTPTILAELAATYRKQPLFDKVVSVLIDVCDGVLDTDAPEVLRIELEDSQPYDAITSRPWMSVTRGQIEAAVLDPKVQAFYDAGAFGSEKTKGLLACLDPLRKVARKQLGTFEEYVEARRRACLADFLAGLVKRRVIPDKARDPDEVWSRGAAWRLWSTVCLANEYRRLADLQLPGKGAGSLSDLRIVIEAAYAHEILTADKEFYECGRAANGLVRHPRFSAWHEPRGKRLAG